MNGTHLHIIVCHLPIAGSGFTVLLILFALYMKSKDLKKVSLWFAFITGLLALAAYFTGEPAEGALMTLVPAITENMVEPHEGIAMFYLLALLFIGFLSLAGLVLSRASEKVLHRFVIIVLILNLSASFLAAKTSITGGKIRHTEMEIKH